MSKIALKVAITFNITSMFQKSLKRTMRSIDDQEIQILSYNFKEAVLFEGISIGAISAMAPLRD